MGTSTTSKIDSSGNDGDASTATNAESALSQEPPGARRCGESAPECDHRLRVPHCDGDGKAADGDREQRGRCSGSDERHESKVHPGSSLRLCAARLQPQAHRLEAGKQIICHRRDRIVATKALVKGSFPRSLKSPHARKCRAATTGIGDSKGKGWDSSSVSLLTDLDAFTREHDRCGKLNGGVDEIRPGDGAVMTGGLTKTDGYVPLRRADAFTSAPAEQANELSRAGCIAFIPKPFVPAEFQRLVPDISVPPGSLATA
jgi:hypothetical protein